MLVCSLAERIYGGRVPQQRVLESIGLFRLDDADHGRIVAGWADRRPDNWLPPSARAPIAGPQRELRRVGHYRAAPHVYPPNRKTRHKCVAFFNGIFALTLRPFFI